MTPVVPGINLDEVQGKYKILTPGIQAAVVESSSIEQSKAKQPKVVFKGKVIEGPDAGEEIGVQFSLQPQALWKLRGFRDACKIATGPDLDTDLFTGAKFRFAAKPKELTDDNGKPYQTNEFEDFFPYEQTA